MGKFLLGFILVLAVTFQANAQDSTPKPSFEIPVPFHISQNYFLGKEAWKCVIVLPKITQSDLILVAKKLHADEPMTHFHILTDDKEIQAFVNWKSGGVSLIEAPYLERWVKKHHIGMVNLMLDIDGRKGASWQLTDPGGSKISELPEVTQKESDQTLQQLPISSSESINASNELTKEETQVVVDFVAAGLALRLDALKPGGADMKALEKFAATYGQIAQNPRLTKWWVNVTMREYSRLREGAKSAMQVSQASDETSILFLNLQAAQNQILIEQNKRIIDLLEQIAKRK